MLFLPLELNLRGGLVHFVCALFRNKCVWTGPDDDDDDEQDDLREFFLAVAYDDDDEDDEQDDLRDFFLAVACPPPLVVPVLTAPPLLVVMVTMSRDVLRR